MSWLDDLQARDPDRAGVALLAPPASRPRLLTLAALNAELSRLPTASADPLLSQIRAQWWVEALERMANGGTGETPLLQAVTEAWGREAARLVALAEGWREACNRESDDSDAILGHLDATAGEAMWQAASILGATAADEGAVRAQGRAAGTVNWLRGREKGGRSLAEAAGAAFARAANSDLSPAIAPALYPGPRPRAALADAADGKPVPLVAEFTRRLALLRFATTRNWRVSWRR